MEEENQNGGKMDSPKDMFKSIDYHEDEAIEQCKYNRKILNT